MTTRERMSGVDTAWLRMETPTNLMMIVGVMMFREKLDLATVRRVIAARFLAYPRFRCRAAQDAVGRRGGKAMATRHGLARAQAPRPRTDEQGRPREPGERSRLTPLDFSRPLWQFHLVDYGTGSALIQRIHHCYADGIALIQVMLSMTHATAAGSLAVRPAPKRAKRRVEKDFWEQILAPVSGALDGATRVGKGILAGKGVDFATEVARIILMGKDAETRFRGKLGTRKRAAWAEPLPLDQVKVVGKALGCSINDVLLSMAAGALRNYLLERGDAVADEIRAIVPVNLRPVAERRSSAITSVSCSWRCHRHREPAGAAPGGAQSHARAEGLLPAAHRAGPPQRRRIRSAGHPGPGDATPRAERERRDDQRAGPAAPALFRRAAHRRAGFLGAAVRRHRHGRVDPLLRRAHPVRRDHRLGLVPDPDRIVGRFARRIRKAPLDHPHEPVAVAA
jgi:hypothetical protein